MARSSLARLRRSLSRTARVTGKSAREREREIEYLLDDDPAVQDLEDQVLSLENDEDQADRKLKIILNEQREHEWLVRAAMTDALTAFAQATFAPGLQMIGTLAMEQLTEHGRCGSESEYMTERDLR